VKPDLHPALVWLLDTAVMTERAIAVDNLLGCGDTDRERNVWATTAMRHWLEERPYTTESTVPEGSVCYMCGSDKQLWFLPPYEYPMCIDRADCRVA
jgi:hypothetical protein